MLGLRTMAVLCICASAGGIALQQSNPIVEIQLTLIERVTYYYNEINTVCLHGVDPEAQLSGEQARSLSQCLLGRYQKAHVTWSQLNQELIDKVRELSLDSVDAFVPEAVTDVKEREDQVNFIASAYDRMTQWYRLMGDTVNRLHTAGMFDAERQRKLIEQFNHSLAGLSAAGREAIAILGRPEEQTPEQVRAILNNALEALTGPAHEDMAQLAEQAFEARVQFERRLERELEGGSNVEERLADYAPVVRPYLKSVEASFLALRSQAWQVWADLIPQEDSENEAPPGS